MTSLYKTIRDRYSRKGLNVTQEVAAQFITGQNASIVNQTGFAADTYLAKSNVTLDPGSWRAGGVYRCRFDMTKTAAGVAAPAINVRLGTGVVADTSILAITLGIGTAAVDTGIFDLELVFRTVGSSTTAVVQSILNVFHTAATGAGLTTTADKALAPILTTSSGFDSSKGSVLGISFNGGASFAGTNTFVRAGYSQQ